MSKPRLVFVTQEPHASYHLAPLIKLAFDIVHLQPAPIMETITTATSLLSVLDGAAALVVTGGLTTEHTRAAMRQARKRSLPVIFVELAYPAQFASPASISPDVVLATTGGGLALYRRYFPKTPAFVLAQHPALTALPARRPAATPHLLLGTSVSAELPDGGATLLQHARELVTAGHFSIRVRPHPMENRELWREFDLSSGTALAEDLIPAWGFVAYQSTAFLTSEAMGVPTFYVADEQWQRELLPAGYSGAKAFDGATTATLLAAKGEGASTTAVEMTDWQALLTRYIRT